MCLTWVVGVFGATAGCQDLSYLRGSQQLPDMLESEADRDDHPVLRSGVVREKARLQALGKLHQVAFPIRVGKLLLGALLVLASGAALAGRPSARAWTLQAVIANAALAALDFAAMGPVRDAMADAVARDVIATAGSALPGLGTEESIELYRGLFLWVERFRLALLEVGVFGGAAYVLTRQRTKAFFRAMAQPSGADGKGDQGT